MSGVPGLTHFTIRGGGFCEADVLLIDCALKDSTLLVDGNSLAWMLFERWALKKQADVTSKDLDDIERQVRELFAEMISNIKEVIVVISEERGEPENQDAATNISGDNIRANLQAPTDIVRVIRSVAFDVGIKIDFCNRPIYDRVAALSRFHKSPILTDDGYFFRRAPKYGLIPWHEFVIEPRNCLFRLDPVSRSNTELHQSKLGLIYALLGCSPNEGGDQQRVLRLLQNKLAFIVSPSECKRNGGRKWNQRVLIGVLSQLCDKTFTEAKEFVVELANESDKQTVKSIIDKGIYDLAFDHTARELRETIEDICGCPNHSRVRVAQWIELLYTQARRPRKLLSSLFRQLRIELDSCNDPNSDSEQPSQIDRRRHLLKGLHYYVEDFDNHLKNFQANLDDEAVQEFFTVKLLTYALNVESPKRKFPVEFTRATLSCLVYYLGGNDSFLTDYRDGLVEEIDHCGFKLRTPLRNISACNQETLRHVETLIELIWTFNELNALAAYPMRPLRPEKWLNICLIYNFTEDPKIMGDELPDEIGVPFEPRVLESTIPEVQQIESSGQVREFSPSPEAHFCTPSESTCPRLNQNHASSSVQFNLASSV